MEEKEKLKRMKKFFTTHDIAEMMGVTMQGVIKWTEKGSLPAVQTPGGHRRIRREDLLSFLKANNIPMPAELKENSDKSVYVVDDDKAVLSVAGRILKKKFPELAAKYFDSSITALIEAGKEPPDLIILDIVMPGMDGWEMLKKIKESDLLYGIPVIAMSGKIDEKEAKEIVALGAVSFLKKPFDLLEFTLAVTEALKINETC